MFIRLVQGAKEGVVKKKECSFLSLEGYNVSELIKDLRSREGITLISKNTGVDSSTLYKYLKGGKCKRRDIYEALTAYWYKHVGKYRDGACIACGQFIKAEIVPHLGEKV